MYLIHLALEPCGRGVGGGSLPTDTGSAIAACAGEADALEHVTVHRDDPTRPVVGFFLRAACLAEAEAAAERLWRRTAACRPDLRTWHVTCSESPLFVPDTGWPWWPRTE
ncbi:hypothetical protein JIX56_29340 [Streptomyces sp. CA-210063]|uniref:hypothetical protein n=1 Tax=Streptomyces sp. CA-210063 TaxID=2801029 RepID=UPI00214BF15F|nr:hypothetical protein [Streptomyces sp. CA-210063]UUU33622.1 hypothetical protein JIX56_29340 [Streptomyces sp. CA-210063]